MKTSASADKTKAYWNKKHNRHTYGPKLYKVALMTHRFGYTSSESVYHIIAANVECAMAKGKQIHEKTFLLKSLIEQKAVIIAVNKAELVCEIDAIDKTKI